MAIIMAAMSGIIGGEIVLLGLIALPNMLRLGYDQNLAIGTICASGSLGTMIPPSIVLIIYGLVTETSIYALFHAARSVERRVGKALFSTCRSCWLPYQ